MVSNSVKSKCESIWQRRAKLQVETLVEGVETRRHPPKCSNTYGEGIVQGVAKVTQTRIRWLGVQVPPEAPIKL